MEFHEINIYRMTHIENIPHILNYGITHKDSPNRNPNYKDIGDLQIIKTRTEKKRFVNDGNFFDASTEIILGDYIPFYFGVRMPMLFVSMHGGNFVENATRNENIVYLVCNVKKLDDSGLFTFFFTDGSAVNNWTTFYRQGKLQDIPTILDYDAIKSIHWDGQENLIKKWKKQAEFLIKEDIPVDLIIGFVCYNENVKTKLIEMGVAPDIIRVFPKAYY